MDILNGWDVHFLFSLGLIMTIFLVFYAAASKKQSRALFKVDESLKRQTEANQQLNVIVNELRRTNRLLTEIAGIEGSEVVPVSSESQHKLYVGNIDYSVTESELASYFSQYGSVGSVNIPINRYTGKARGFGFVSFTSQEDAERAIALHGTEFKGRQIQVNFAKERERDQ